MGSARLLLDRGRDGGPASGTLRRMTAPAEPRSSWRGVALAAVAGLAIGGGAFALTRGGDGDAQGRGAPLLPSALPSAGPVRTTNLPPEAAAKQGGRYVAVFLVVAGTADDRRLTQAQQRAQQMGYQGGIGELGCTAGAQEQLGLPADEPLTAYSIFFTSKSDADRFVTAYGAPVAGIASISAGCLD